ncbi:MAG: hypothetical protein KF760_15095 [Candidatus Eremiobacteraeota bacterium]|nr:hypothetical protein [Candidatus Eremiobacteraeota bacterium]MCW5866366.1 hypothetical protein [Candidatus Eremiobacteraeota bacterium]
MKFLFRARSPQPGTAELQYLRGLAPGLGLGEIRRRAAEGVSLFEIAVFEGDWPEGRQRLSDLLERLESLPLEVSEGDEALTAGEARDRLLSLLEIENQVRDHP